MTIEGRIGRLQAVWPPASTPDPYPPLDLSPLSPAEQQEWLDLTTHPPRYDADGRPDLDSYSTDQLRRMYALSKKIDGVEDAI